MKYTRALAPIPHFLCGARTKQPTHTTTDLPQGTQQARGNSDLGVSGFPGSQTPLQMRGKMGAHSPKKCSHTKSGAQFQGVQKL